MKRTEHTQKWLDALRSGEYKQITGRMCTEKGYCCLGVAAQIISAIDASDTEKSYCAVQDAMGLSRDEMYILMSHNDGFDNLRKKTFPEIASIIEGMVDAEACQ
jgi:hypothetical protein